VTRLTGIGGTEVDAPALMDRKDVKSSPSLSQSETAAAINNRKLLRVSLSEELNVIHECPEQKQRSDAVSCRLNFALHATCAVCVSGFRRYFWQHIVQTAYQREPSACRWGIHFMAACAGAGAQSSGVNVCLCWHTMCSWGSMPRK
jgi:hypothetical protein